jgi:hypothetical protein
MQATGPRGVTVKEGYAGLENLEPDSAEYVAELDRLRQVERDTEARITDTLRIISAGGTIFDLRTYAAENQWNVSDRTLHRYINQANKRIAQLVEKDRGKLLNKALVQRETLYARALESGDWRSALACLDSREKLLGLFPTRQAPAATSAVVQLNIQEVIVRAPESSLPRPITINALPNALPEAIPHVHAQAAENLPSS